MNVLYVEDNPSDADLLKRTLSRKAPYIILDWVTTCKEALSKLAASSPDRPLYDLLLTDMELPDGEGVSLISHLHEHRLPIAAVIITGMGSDEAAVAALKAGISDYVAKQGDYLSRLPDVLQTALHRYRAETNRHSESFRVLYVEHDSTDINLTTSHFSYYAPSIRLEIVRTAEDVLKKMPSSENDLNNVQSVCDVLLVDYHLPNLKGVSLLKELLEVRRLDLAVVLLAEHGDKESVTQAFRLGVMDYVVKHPAYLHQLVGVLENAFHRVQLAQKQKALEVSKEYFRSLIENVSDIIIVLDQYGAISYASPSYERLLGFKPEEIVKAKVFSFIHPDDRPSALHAIAETLARPGATGPTLELRIHHKDGSWRYMEAIGKGLKNPSGQSVIIVNLRDVTQRKETEEKLLESEERYRTAIEHSNDGVALVRGDEHIYVNQTFLDIFGYDKPEEILRTSTYMIAHPDDRTMLIEYNQKRQRGEPVPSRYIFKGIKKDGAIRYIDVSAAPVHLKGEPVTLAFLRDITERINSEQKILESEQSLRAILDASPIGIGRVKNRFIDWVNEFMCRMSGYTFEELEGKSTRLLHESDKAFETVGKSLNQTGQAEHRMIRKDGTKRDVLVNISPVNSPSHIFTVIDMTEQKKAEGALRKSEVLYRTLVEKSSEILMLGNAQRKRTYVSPNITKILGYTVEEFLAGSHNDFIHPDSVRIGESARSWVLEHPGESITFEARNRHKNGSWRWFECTARNLLEDPNVNTMVINFKDITERKEAEAALFESETKYRTVVENSLVGFYIIQDNLFRFANKRFCEIFGYAFEEIVDILGPSDLTHPEDREMVEENLRKRLFDGIDNIEYVFRALRKDGMIITLKVLGSSILYNERPAATGTLIDITKEKTLESQLRQAQKMEAIGTLAGGVAHDFNNILTALTGYGTLLQLKLDKGSPLQHYVDQILSASMKGAGLTRSLLAFSRKQPISLNPVNLNNIIKGTEKLLKRLLTEDIILRTLLTSDNIMIMADPTQIDQILFNMVTNARDAMPKGGSLTIETKAVILDREFATTHGFGEPGKYALLSVSDTGAGMDAAVREHIFDPFFTTKEVGKGTGLGLSTIYGIVKQHNGYVTVYSEPDMGAVFRIYFPLTGATIETNPSASKVIRGGKETILVAEDDKEVRQLIRNILVEFGYTIIEARDGEDAILKFSKHKNIDLLILDSVMPKKNGRIVYDEISTISPHIKVIFTSGYTRDVILDKGIEDKQFDFIPKPLSPKDLLEKVREVLDRRQSSITKLP
jgi:two-component system cell cycle sensor histidine kinase/response regulator CckA